MGTAWEADDDPLLHGGRDPLLSEDLESMYGSFSVDSSDPFGMQPDDVQLDKLGTTPLFLAAAAYQYLDTTVTKFLQNDISVTKFLEDANDITVTRFLDTTVTKFLEDNDLAVTKFLD